MSAVSAQAAPAPPAEPAAQSPPADDAGTIVVTARHRNDDILGDVAVLGGQELASQVRSTIGETLAKQPGVTASGSGPNVSKPVLRGLSGDRIRILVDGIGSLDVSSSSSDHAVAINPLTADSIEVLHGPAALLFGSSAIGGIVNVVDSRIPRVIPDSPLSASGTLGYATAAHEKLANGEVNLPLGGGFVAHADAGWTSNDDLMTGGYILSAPLWQEAAASGDPAIRALAALKGRLPNSDGRTFEGAGALAYIDGGFNVGLSVTRHTAFYGVPVRFSLDPSIEAERTHIDVAQTRYDARAEIPFEGLFSALKLRGGYSDYQHQEIAADGAVGSTVISKGGEARADLLQRDRSGWGGISGVQLLDVRQRIDGDEQFLPPSRAIDLGLFTVQHIDLGPLRLAAGARVESARHSADASEVVGNPALSRHFTTVSLSAGVNYSLTSQWKVGLNVAHSQRAPSVEELYANGPHGGNASFELGDPNLTLERSLGVEATISHQARAIDLNGTLYASHYGNFLYQVPTGEVRNNLPVYAFRQGRADYLGFELSAQVPMGTLGGISWGLEGSADATRATIRNFGPAPLIPPLRLNGGITAERGPVSGRVEVEHDFGHSRIAPLETVTPGFTLVNASADWKPLAERPELTLTLALNNIFDAEARRSTSLLKDYAPLAGRDLRLTARFAY
ncbi:MAG: TonB-dependent receptor [Sphingomicrobium sp.]